jgi:hypothetical protein
VPRREKYAPKHRSAPPEPALKKGLRKTAVYSGVAVAATGVAVGSGLALDQPTLAAGGSASLASSSLNRPATQVHHDGLRVDASARISRSGVRGRLDTTSRSAERPPLDPTKTATLDQESGGQVTHTEDLTSQDPRAIAQALLPQFGFSASEFTCLDELYTKESGWNVHADNPASDAYGIPQALPGSKRASAGADWANDAATQIKWGLEYIRRSYGTPCGALNAWQSRSPHWY